MTDCRTLAATTTTAKRSYQELEVLVDVQEEALREADAASVEVKRAAYLEMGTGGGTVVAVQIPIAVWKAVRAVLGRVDGQGQG